MSDASAIARPMPVIGVLPLWDDARGSLWMLPGYLDAIRGAGGLPLMPPITDVTCEVVAFYGLCDGLLFTGGHDVNPALYAERKLDAAVEVSDARDRMELRLLDLVLAGDKPFLGICRGIQLLNVALGGTLYQDIPTQFPSTIDHHQRPPYDRAQHEVVIEGSSPLGSLLGVRRLPVNSYHHQAIKQLAPTLQPMATATDGLVEAVCLPGKRFVWGVQWHPEYSYKVSEPSRLIFKAFVEACGLPPHRA